MFIVNNGYPSVLDGTVVVIRREFAKIRFYRAVMYPPVKIEYRRTVFINDLAATHQPVFHKISTRNGMAERIHMVALGHCRPVKIAFLLIFCYIAFESSTVSHKEPVFNTMIGAAYNNIIFTR